MARHIASAFRRFAFFKTKVEEKSPFLFHFSSTPHLSLSHVAPSHASFCPFRPLCPLALGQSLRTPVGHSLPIPPTSPDSLGAFPAYSTNSPVSPVRPAARNVPFSPSCTATPSQPGTTTIFCPSLSSSSSHSHFFPAAKAHFIVLSPHQRP